MLAKQWFMLKGLNTIALKPTDTLYIIVDQKY